jgi:hypothetical protein
MVYDAHAATRHALRGARYASAPLRAPLCQQMKEFRCQRRQRADAVAARYAVYCARFHFHCRRCHFRRFSDLRATAAFAFSSLIA